MNLAPIVYVIGIVLLTVGDLMLIPALVGAWGAEHDWQPFLTSSALVCGLALLLLAIGRGAQLTIQPRQAFLITTLVWIAASFAGAVPIALHEHVSWTDAVFESMSGITTTGSTVLTGLDGMSPAILLWRSLLQWLGGLGFMLMAIAILPLVGVGGMRLFRSESSDWSDKALPHTRDIAKTVGLIYTGLGVLCAFAYWLAGMSPFDAVNHAMATVSTGGYSTSDASMGKFGSPAILWVGTMFMIAGSLPFMVYFHMLRQGVRPLLQDEQVRAYAAGLVAVVALATLLLTRSSDRTTFDALTQVAFNVVSVVSTTGFASTDYTQWGSFFVALFFFLMFTGGCSGSTSGSIKVFRLQIGLKFLSLQVRRLVHPRGVFVVKLNGRRLDDDILAGLVAFVFAVGATVIVVALALAGLGLDLVTALSGAATAVTNVGPGLGPVIGPAGNFAALPDAAKWLLAAAMLLGRLELLTVLVLFSRFYWRA